ncbi:hypothetical protein L1987_11703 [Smallanthus sonchifolius]|uniref:Uncharacterized protein n=1 Tax=Smallanthus sonchifolius TaxID=185202 RepID=A0ACB9JD77_9ASTR|nr:hypothetical protein L1987_11703 [Smallanthus sonchifolius]
MAIPSSHLLFLCLLTFFTLSFAIRPNHFNLSTVATHWSTAAATWYGSPDGAGSDGGSCGYGNAVSQAPFSSMVTGIGPSLYNSGKECGACYAIKCTKHPSCSRKPARVVITDFCPGGPCASDHAHFDLSGTAFGAMAKPGQAKHLRDAGVLQIRFARVKCDYSRTNLVFHVDQGSNPNYFAVVVEFEEGDGDLAGVSLKEANSNKWLKMVQSWGAVWKVDPGRELHPPFSIRLISQYSEQVLVAKNVIPSGWTPGATYRSLLMADSRLNRPTPHTSALTTFSVTTYDNPSPSSTNSPNAKPQPQCKGGRSSKGGGTEVKFDDGMEAVGVVTAVGPGVTGQQVGDVVAYAGDQMGAYAEEQVLPADKVVPVPSSVDPTVAASVMLKGMTAQFLLRRCFKVESGHTVLVHAAAGGVGSLLCQWANALGATVIGTVSTAEKAAQAKEDGCHHVIDTNKKILLNVLLTSHQAKWLKWFMILLEKTPLSFGQSSGTPDPVPLSALAAKSLFLTRPSLKQYTAKRDELLETAGEVFANISNGVLRVRVNHKYPLSQASQAHLDIENRKTTGSVVLIPDGTCYISSHRNNSRLSSDRSPEESATMGAYTYVSELWRKKQSDVMRFMQRVRCWEYRQLPSIVRVTHPTRPDKARRMGYKAKQGYVIYRVRVRRGGRKRPVPKGIVYGKPTNQGVTQLKFQRSKRSVAEERAGRKLGGLKVLNSYWLNEDSTYKYFEVILVDPAHAAIRNDPRINWICKPVHKHRELRGLTSAGKKYRGLRGKGHLNHKARPSRRATWKRNNTLSLRRYR